MVVKIERQINDLLTYMYLFAHADVRKVTAVK